MKVIFSKSPLIGLRTVILILFSVALIICDRYVPSFSIVKGTLENIVTPLQYAVNWPIAVVENFAITMSSKRVLLDENAKLRAEIILLEAKQQKLISLEQENIKLRGLVTSGILAEKEKFLIANLLAVNTNNFNHKVLLDKGTSNGLYIGQPVLDAYGIMGQIIDVSTERSTVLLLTDTKSAIPVKITRNGNRSILIGTGSFNYLELAGVSETFDVKKGDTLVTSDLGSRFPDGYPVGTVTKVERVLGEQFLKVIVSPSARVNQDRQLLLIWPSQQLKKLRNHESNAP